MRKGNDTSKSRTSPEIEYFSPGRRRVTESHFPSRELRALRTVNSKVSAGESLDDVMNSLFDCISKVNPKCDRLGLSLLVEDSRRATAHWTRAEYEPVLLKGGYSEDIQGTSLDKLLQGNKVRIINDLPAYLRKHPSSRSSRILVKEGVRSNLTVPLKVEHRVVGLLFMSSRASHSFSRRHALFALATAERLSQTIEKAALIEQLIEASSSYSEMLGFVSHELKSPVASIVTDANLLLDGYLGDMDLKQKEKIAKMVVKAEYLLSLVKDYLDLARLEGPGLKADPKDDVNFIEDVVEPCIDILTPQMEEKDIRLERDYPKGLLSVCCDPSLMKTAVINFIGNAVKYGIKGGKVRIKAEKTREGLSFSVWNEGPGFPPEGREKLFKRFSRIRTEELMKQKGTGVGLYSTRRIIQLHKGKVDAHSEQGRWAEFSFSIPLPAESNGNQKQQRKRSRQ
ncbi:MAG: GAF domain-containing sensor histidine kinase [Victivallales bacterium]|nr:GAF domain-containing sensor histidine kinase [Victivallales bacterium]